MNFNRVTLQHNNEFVIIVFCYLIVSVITMCNLIKGLIRATFLSTPASDMMFMNDEDKRHVQAIKTASALVRISEIRVYMLLYLGLFMDTGLAVISIIRLQDLNISA